MVNLSEFYGIDAPSEFKMFISIINLNNEIKTKIISLKMEIIIIIYLYTIAKLNHGYNNHLII